MRQFLKYVLASMVGSFLFFIMLGTLLTLGALGLVGLLVAGLAETEEVTPVVDRDSMLVYDLATLVPDTATVLSPSDLFLGSQVPNQLTLRRALLALEAAAEDDNIAGLYIKGTNAPVGAGLAAQTELRKALQTFKESGKPILAYDVSWTEREYFLAAMADTLYMNPFGQLEMNGLFTENMYQAEALEKLGIGVQVTRVGKYKSAVEPFLRENMSPEEKEQTRKLLWDIWQEVLDVSAQAREIQPQQLQSIANNQGYLFGEEAETATLVDQIAYEDEVLTDIRKLTGQSEADLDPELGTAQASFRQIPLARYADTVEDDLKARRSAQQIALVYAEGPIIDGDGNDGFSQDKIIAGDQVARQLRKLRQDDDVKAVVLRVNSPGGSATASEIILREVRLLQESGKPVVVSMGNVAASGGYWISSLADKIVAEPTTITGSIGVFSLFLNLEDLGDNVGINWDGVKTAELADIFSSTRPKTEKELAILQKAVDQIYDAFLDRVVEGRDLPREKVAEIAQGRVWSGKAALELGLVDELGGLDRAIALAAELAEIDDDWRLREFPEGDVWDRFFSRFVTPEQIHQEDLLTTQINRFKDDIELLRTFNDPQGVYALMLYDFQID